MRTAFLSVCAFAILSGCGGGGGNGPSSHPTAPTITTQPQSHVAEVGASVTFAVAASGSGLTYQWFRGANPIDGATGASFTINPVTSTDFATYTVHVTNAQGTTVSGAANLTIEGAPIIETQPAAAESLPGGSVTFTVVATGDAPLTYQWSKDGVEISGATNASYTVSPVADESGGQYTVVVTNAKGSATSNSAPLTVLIPTVPSISSQPAPKTVPAGTSVTFSVTASALPAPSYQWYKDGVQIPAANNSTFTIASPVIGDSGNYTVLVYNSAGSVLSEQAALTVAVVPTITQQPASQTVNPGSSATFTVVAAGTAPLSYKWKKDGVDIPNATSASLTLTGVTATNAGGYRVVVTNAVGTVTSDVATLNVNSAPVIVQQPVIVVTGSSTSVRVVASGSAPLGYQWFKNGQAVSGANGATYVLGTVTSANRGIYYVEVSNTVGSVTSDLVNVQ